MRRRQRSPSLRRVTGTKRLRTWQVPLRKLLGRLQSQVSKKRARKAHYSHRHYLVSRLEHPLRLPLYHSRSTAQVLQMWKKGSWGTKLSSSTERKIPSHLINLELGT